MAQRGPVYEKVEYVIARLAATGLNTFSVDENLRTARFIGAGFDRFDTKHRLRAQHNIRISFPEWSEERIAQCARNSYQHLIQLAFEIVQTPRVLNEDSWPEHVTLKNVGPALDLMNSDQPLILVGAHLGNWEVLGYTLALLGYDLDTIARPLDNDLINAWLLGIRERKGMRILTKFNASDRMIGVMEKGGLLAFTADQNAGEKGIFVPFFGRLASTYKSIGLLAMTHNAPIVAGYAFRSSDRFTFDIGLGDVIYPEDWADQPDPLYYITARYCRAFENMVRLCPDQFLWSHRRWKTRPRHELQGKPMPRSLRKNLESLPWMNDDLMRQLDNPPPIYTR